jgi:hypothetical protein
MKWRREGHLMLAQNAGGVRLALGRMRRDTGILRRAAADLIESLEAFRELALPFGQAEAARVLAQVLTVQADMEGKNDYREEASDLYRYALKIFEDAGATRDATETREDLRLLQEAGDRSQANEVARHRPLYIVR